MFTQDPEVIKVGMKIIQVIAPSYVLFIFIEILSSALRGIGDVLIPMIMTCGGVCLLRIFWIFAVVPHIPGIQSILMSYPISWALTAVLFIIYYFVKQKKFTARFRARKFKKPRGSLCYGAYPAVSLCLCMCYVCKF